jgi:hypothetical protein
MPALFCNPSLKRFAAGQQFCSEFHSPRIVHRKQPYRRTPARRTSVNVRIPDDEVLLPSVSSGMKQQNNVTAQRIETRQIRPLAQIAAMAGQRQIIRFVGASVLFGDNVFDVVAKLAVLLA